MSGAVVAELDALGRALGGMRWVQGPGGNVSVKHGGNLFVKASGVRLTDVASQHARVPLEIAVRAVDGDREADIAVFAVEPRPSLETYFHAIGPDVVVHTHALGVLLAACATKPVRDLGVPCVPFRRPGREIALAVRSLVERDGVHVIVLASHGVITYASTVREAVDATHAIDERVRESFSDIPDIDDVVASYRRAPEVAIPGGVARALPDRSWSGKYLFPDAVVYASAVRVETVDIEAAARATRKLSRPIVLHDMRGRRMAVARKSSQLAFATEVAAAHDWVDDALSARRIAKYLPEDEPAKILNLPAEQYRIDL